jgi:hypothetical protein
MKLSDLIVATAVRIGFASRYVAELDLAPEERAAIMADLSEAAKALEGAARGVFGSSNGSGQGCGPVTDAGSDRPTADK